MELEKRTLDEGDKTIYPQNGDTVEVRYTAWVYKQKATNQRGKRINSSPPNTLYEFVIGEGTVIQGWDQAVTRMSLGERAIWKIPSHLAYASAGFPGLVPPNADLIFEIYLNSVNSRYA